MVEEAAKIGNGKESSFEEVCHEPEALCLGDDITSRFLLRDQKQANTSTNVSCRPHAQRGALESTNSQDVPW